MGRLLVGISVLWVGLAFVGDGVTTVVVPVLAERATAGATASALGLVTFVGLAVGALMQPPAGALSDRLLPRYGRRGPLAAGLVLTVAALAALGLVGSSGGVAGLVVAFVAVSAAAALTQAALQGWIPDLVALDRRGRAAGWKGFADVGGASIAFLVLGQAVVAGTGPAVAVAAAAVASGGLLALALVREPPRSGSPLPAASFGSASARAASRPPRPAGPFTALLGVFRVEPRRAGPLIDLIVARFLFLLGVFAVGRFLVLAVADRFGLPAADAAEQASLALAMLALVSMLAAPPAGRAADHVGRLPVMVFGAFAGSAGTLGMAAAPTLPLLVVAGAVLALGNAAFTTANWAMTTDVVPADEAARYLGLANLGTAGAAAVAGLLGPVIDVGNRLAPGWGHVMLLVAAASAMVSAAAVAIRVRRAAAPEVAPPPSGTSAAPPRG